MGNNHKVQLITYPDSMGGNLANLALLLEKHFPGMFEGGIHILPPFPSSGDRGFAPITYLEIDPSHGSWEDIRVLGEKYGVMLDVMVNHISARSPVFRDFLANGESSPYTGCFLTLDKLWPDSIPKPEDLDQIFLRRRKPYSEYQSGTDGQLVRVWTTFGKTDPSEQIDLDINEPKVKALFEEIFMRFSRNGVKGVRLDAIGYVIKKPGTSCFFVEPEIYGFLGWIKEMAEKYHMEVLPELHSSSELQQRLAEQGFWIYDFILPYVVLDALLTGECTYLYQYLRDRPACQYTTLDCHDGIPVQPDVGGVIPAERMAEITEICAGRGAGFSRILSEQYKSAGGYDVHQILGTYYSLLDCDDDSYLAARAIQLFTPGIPQIYYVGLLAGENDLEAVKITGEARALNRHNYTAEEIAVRANLSVVRRLCRLIRFRDSHPAFDGRFSVRYVNEKEIILEWKDKDCFCELTVDLDVKTAAIHYSTFDGEEDREFI